MSAFWELCNPKSRAILGYLYKLNHGHFPDWDERSGKKDIRPSIIIDANIEDEPDQELTKLMKQPPSAEGRGDY